MVDKVEKILTLYSDVQATSVHWLWYPFIAVGKLTLLQGDPGDGKSTMMMNLIAELSKGGKTPDGKPVGMPQRIIYQCSEDADEIIVLSKDVQKYFLETYGNGGSETYIFKLGEALEQHGHEVQYFGMEHEGRCVGNRVNAYTSGMDFHGGSKLSKLTYPIK
ncbi:AAA family ATPase [Gemmiger qucibialis]|uniref:AAA family ATPase n=1 Tax=Gemmiger qucibialis TaxID=2997294 RepID=UPI002FD9B293